MLPQDMVRLCQRLVDKYYDEFLDLISQGYTGDVICSKIGICE